MLKLNRDKLEFLLEKLQQEVANKERFTEVCNTLVKILTNITENPNNEKYYKIKKVFIYNFII